MKRRLSSFLIILILVLFSGSAWLLGSASGNQRLLQWALGDDLKIGSYQGSLLGTLTLKETTFTQADLQISVQSLQIQWKPIALFKGLLHIEQIRAEGIIYSSEPTVEQAESTPLPSLPVSVQLDQTELTNLQIKTGPDTQTIKHLSLNAAAKDQTLQIADLKIQYESYEASAQGQVNLAEHFPFQFNIQWQGELPEVGALGGSGMLQGDMKSISLDHTTHVPFSVGTRGTIDLQTQEPTLALEGEWQQLSWPLAQPRIQSDTGRYKIIGTLSHPKVSSEAELLFPETGTPPINVDLTSNISSSGLTDLSLSIREKSQADSAIAIQLQGAVTIKDEVPLLDLKGTWDDTRWPLLEDPMAKSPSGRFQLSGPLQQIKLAADTTLMFPQKQAPDMQAHIQGLITPSGINELVVDSVLLDGKLQVTGQLAWDPVLSWDLALNGESLDPAQHWPEWPGRLNIKADISGGDTKQGLWVKTDLKQVTGTLQQHPLDASGDIRYDASGLKLKKLNIHNGPNQLVAQGDIGEKIDLTYQLNAPDLNTVSPALKGNISAQGQITGEPTNPSVETTLKANDLQYNGHGVKQIEGQLIWKKGTASGQLNAKGLSSKEWRGESLSIAIEGKPEAHTLELALNAQALSINTTLQGGWQIRQWQGELQQLSIRQSQFGQWSTTAPSSLLIGAEQLQLSQTCLRQDNAEICTLAEWSPATSRLSGNLTALPLSRLLFWLPEEIAIDGALNGEFKLAGPPAELKGNARLLLKQGVLLLESDEQQPLRLDLNDGSLTLQIAPDENRADVQIKAGDGTIAFLAKTGSLTTDKPVPLSGSLKAEIPDLKPLALLLPGLTDIQGKLNADATLKGYLRNPDVQGYIYLTEGAANVPQLGLALENIALTAKNEGTERLLLEGKATSGGGLLTAKGDLLLNAKQGWPLTLKLQGKNVQIVRLPEAEAFATPDLDITLRERQLAVQGTLEIPKATILFKELPKTAVSLSDDEIIIGRTEQTTQTSPLNIDAQIKLKVGDQVRFSGFGLDTRLQGLVDLQSKQGRNLAQGELTLKEGRYKAYGQDLTITQGQLLFNGPPENPNLDVKAQRVSLDQSVTAIIALTGNLRTPQVQVTSTPSLPEEEALSYLITGQELSAEGPGKAALLRQAVATKGLEKSQEILNRIATGIGVDEVRIQEGSSLEDTSLLLGKYLSPDLYVSYAVGLFDNRGALITRYRLSERLRLEVQSGSSQSMDLFYDVEK